MVNRADQMKSYDSVRAAVTGAVTVGHQHCCLSVEVTLDIGQGSFCADLYYCCYSERIDSRTETPLTFLLTSADEHNLIGPRKRFEGVLPHIS